MADTIAILRGLKEKYEVHHGVRITDNALVAAATLSDRYIGDRFLPDKAIDLVDEAASRLRIEIDSLPQEIDEVERRIVQLEIERQALLKEKDKAGVERRQGGRAGDRRAQGEERRDEGAVAGGEAGHQRDSEPRSRRSRRCGPRWTRRRGGATSRRRRSCSTAGSRSSKQELAAQEKRLARDPGERPST